MGASIAFLISSITVAIIQIIVFLKISNSTFQEILLKKIDFYTVKDFLKEQLGKTISILFHNNTMKMVSKIKK